MQESRRNQTHPGGMRPPDDYCNAKWAEAMKICELNLSEAERAYFRHIGSFEAFKQNLNNIDVRRQSGQGLLQRVALVVDPLLSFATLLAACLSSSTVETAIVWGLLFLLLRAASRTESLLPETISMVEDLGHDLEVFSIHGKTFEHNPRIADDLMEIFVEIIMSWAEIIHFLNRNKFGISQRSWPSVREKFENTLQRIRKRAEQIKEKASAFAQVQAQDLSQAGLLQQLDRMGFIASGPSHQSSSNTEDAVFPCCNIPFARNNSFFGRENELAEVHKHLDDQSSVNSFRSFALYGTGGIGKTQTALAYAYGQKDAGINAILWFNCETGISMARSFTDAASLLQLEGTSDEETSEQNKFLVLRWLRRTKRTWLCVFDNVEDLEIFRNAWPVADSGKVLVTSRNDIVSIDPAAGGMEIKAFDRKMGCEMILRHVNRSNYSESEAEAARMLTDRLGGLALALVIMASQIRLRKCSISAFAQLYARHATKLNQQTGGIESYYKLSLATCWQTTFDYLTPNASALLGVISQFGPDALPEELFHPSDESKLPQALEFCADDWLYLMESGAWSEEIILMDTAMEICENKNDVLYAILANSRGAMECERGHCDEAYKYIKPSLEIFRQVHGNSHPEVGNGFNNYANIVLQDLRDGACEEAITLYHKALGIFEANGPGVYKKLFHIPHTNLARAHTVLKQADYHVGNALFAMGRHDEAESHWLRALDLFEKENEVHPTTNAAKIKLAMVHMERGSYNQAILILEEVLIIAKLLQPSKGDSGEVARVQRKLAEAYQQKGDIAKAEKFKFDAERMRREVQGDRFPELPDCDLSYAMMSFHAFW
ncbi:hypothetical protein NW762_010226 [Fusarium torreyae]|uniref:NB-ARC domain-containing protein n=1 Tax=Fusarium torreyae TaxID=1237075 RepID=A0A9W8VAW4_9HYPO|nr:hypothetical protein NW762_010226 [Fusarium torreyae]